jgi:O-antigen ligase
VLALDHLSKREFSIVIFKSRVLVAVIAMALQVQATLPLGASGVRIAVSDLFLPIGLIYVGRCFITSPTRLQWRMPGVWWWLLGISLALSIALWVGYESSGHWLSWALYNKWVGWFALASYFIIGGVIGQACGTALRGEFLQIFLVTAAVIGLINSLAMPWLLPHYSLPIGIEFSRATGGMQNSNAFGFLLAVAVLLALATQKQTLLYLPPLLTALWFTASRGALFAIAIGLVVHFFLARRISKQELKALAITVVAIATVMMVSITIQPDSFAKAKRGIAPIGFFSMERLDLDGNSFNDRENQNRTAISLFVEAPFFGQGIGYFVKTAGVTMVAFGDRPGWYGRYGWISIHGRLFFLPRAR